MCSGIWPPSKAAGTCLRALVPLVPRPAVLPPLPASPRPTRNLSFLAPGAGARSWSLIGSLMVYLLPRHFFTLAHVADGVDPAADLRGIRTGHGLVPALQAEGAQRVLLVLLGTGGTADLGDLQCHVNHAPWPARARSIPAGATSSMDLPRRAATSSGRTSCLRASTVAWTTLMSSE